MSEYRVGSARRMTDSFREVPHFALTVGLDVGPLTEARAKLVAGLDADSPRPTINDLLIRGVALALKAERQRRGEGPRLLARLLWALTAVVGAGAAPATAGHAVGGGQAQGHGHDQ